MYFRTGQSVESALIALAAIFWLIARILTIFDKKYHNLTCRNKRESYLVLLLLALSVTLSGSFQPSKPLLGSILCI